ncbi:hypothetical protein HK098_007331 [Nowakowskiella sp. JEL0407]|nr:hypothetical protein HK098_007331 [Nowakowskiella sp. JEL0407]
MNLIFKRTLRTSSSPLLATTPSKLPKAGESSNYNKLYKSNSPSDKAKNAYMRLSASSPLISKTLKDSHLLPIKARRRESEHRALQVQKNIHLRALKNNQPIYPSWVFSTGNFRVSPKKLNLVARLIRTMTVDEAKIQMKTSPKWAAVRVLRLLNRAEANLKHNFDVDLDKKKSKLVIKQAWVGKGVYLKRIRPHGRGRTGRMTRPFSHVKILFELQPADTQNVDGVPSSIATYEQNRVKKMEEDFQLIYKWMKSRRTAKNLLTMPDHHSLKVAHPVWSSKPWKYVSSEKWKSPDNALMRGLRGNQPKILADHWRHNKN